MKTMNSTKLLCNADVVVIGAGIMGASTAFQLGRLGQKNVVLLDQYPPLGGMSGRTFGQIRQHYSNELIVDLSIRGFEVFQNWEREVGFGDPGYRRFGYLLLVVAKQMEALKRNVALGKRLGVNTRVVCPEEIKELEPALVCHDLAGGAFEPNGGYIDVARMLLSWLTGAQSYGVRLLSGCRAERLLTQNGQIVGVQTSMGKINTPLIVVATGAWGQDLLKPLDIDVPIKRLRLDTAYISPQNTQEQINTCITDGNSNVVVRPDMGRDILAAAYPPVLPEVVDPCASASPEEVSAHQKRLEQAFSERIPSYCGAKMKQVISGAYDVTPDFHPILGWAPSMAGLYLALGFSGHGLKLSPAVGEIIAAAIMEKTPPFNTHPLRLERFVENDLMHLAYGPNSARA